MGSIVVTLQKAWEGIKAEDRAKMMRKAQLPLRSREFKTAYAYYPNYKEMKEELLQERSGDDSLGDKFTDLETALIEAVQ